MTVTTDWLTIATEGPTLKTKVTLTKKVMSQIVDNYDKKERAAALNYEHNNWGNSYGEVQELQLAVDEKKRSIIQAKIKPNANLYDINRRGEVKYFSIEAYPVYPNLKTKKREYYLTALAVTKSPASLGTSELILSSSVDGHEDQGIFSESIECSFALASEDSKQSNNLEKKEMNALSRFAALLMGKEQEKINLSQKPPKETKKMSQDKNITMTQEQLNKSISDAIELSHKKEVEKQKALENEQKVIELSTQVEKLQTSITDLTKKLSGLETQEKPKNHKTSSVEKKYKVI